MPANSVISPASGGTALQSRAGGIQFSSKVTRLSAETSMIRATGMQR